MISQNNFKKRRITLFSKWIQVTLMKVMWPWHENTQIEKQNRTESRNRPALISIAIFLTRKRDNSTEKIVFWKVVLKQLNIHIQELGFPGGSNGKEYACRVRDPRWIPGSGRSPGEGNGNPPFLCQENSMDRGAWQAIVHGVTKTRTQLTNTFTFMQELDIYMQ